NEYFPLMHGKYKLNNYKPNLAVGAPAVQSSTYNSLGAAKNAVDGNSDSNYMRGSCTHTAGDNPWWRVDLRKPHKVTRVIITNRGDCCAERIAGAQIRIGNSLAYNGNRNWLVTTIRAIPSGGTQTFDFSPVKGRYVNIYLPGTNKYLTLCEVQVFEGEIKRERKWFVCFRSSTNYVNTAFKAVDGNRAANLANDSCTYIIAKSNPWWRVTLQQPYKIVKVSITNRGDCCADRISGAEIRVGNSLVNDSFVYSFRVASVYSMLLGKTQKFRFSPVEGQYVNVLLPGVDRILTLCEVEM
uniref:Fucolectin tachylectin-4 pentraxin-1 domain-containing protein n=1 Tax=Cyprinus carpio TaxID=7962 RepID=A0A8C1SNP4_CYPCA